MTGLFAALCLLRPRPAPALLAGSFTLIALAATAPGISLVGPTSRLSGLVDQVSMLSDGSATNEAIADARIVVTRFATVDPATAAEVAGHRVHVSPTLASVAWAYRLQWHPEPTFQSYVAYEEGLDHRNAETLADPDGPDRSCATPRRASTAATGCGTSRRRCARCSATSARSAPRRRGRCSPAAATAAGGRASCATWRRSTAARARFPRRARRGALRRGARRAGQRARAPARDRAARAGPPSDRRRHPELPARAGHGGRRARPARAAGRGLPAPFSLSSPWRTIAFTKGTGIGSGTLRLRFIAVPVAA
jgi:hypothetical protein